MFPLLTDRWLRDLIDRYLFIGYNGNGIFDLSKQFVAFGFTYYSGIPTRNGIWSVSKNTLGGMRMVLIIYLIFFFSAGAIQNLGLALFSIFTGLIVGNFGYTAIEIFFISSLVGELLYIRLFLKLFENL